MSQDMKTPGQIAFEAHAAAVPTSYEWKYASQRAWEAAAAAVERRVMEQMHLKICALAVQMEHLGKTFTWSDAATMVFDASRPPGEVLTTHPPASPDDVSTMRSGTKIRWYRPQQFVPDPEDTGKE